METSILNYMDLVFTTYILCYNFSFNWIRTLLDSSDRCIFIEFGMDSSI